MRFYPAFKIVLAIALGISLGFWLDLPMAWVLVASAGCLLGYILTQRFPSGQALLVLSLIFAGASLHESAQLGDGWQSFPATIQCQILEPPASTKNMTSFAVRTVHIAPDNQPAKDIKLKLWCKLPGNQSHLQTGQIIEISGVIEPLERTHNPGDFNLKAWRERNGYRGVFRAYHNADVQPIKAKIPLRFSIYNIIARKIDSLYPERSSLIQALILGFRRDINDNFYDALRRTGLAHLVALSGLHVGFLLTMILGVSIMLRLGYDGRMIFCIVGLFFYIMLIPPRASTMRAVVMAWLFLSAPLLRRWSPALNTLSVSALIILILRPDDLFDGGFQLSYAAVSGIFLFQEKMQEFSRNCLAHEGKIARIFRKGLIMPLFISFAASALVMPLTAQHFHAMALGGPVFNLFGIILMQFIFMGAWISIWLGLIFQPLGELIAETVNLLIIALEKTTIWASHIAPMWDVRFAPLTVLAVILIVVWVGVSQRRFAFRLIGGALLISGALLIDGLKPMPLKPQIWFLDVGQGDSAVWLFPNGQTVVIDGGPSPGTNMDYPLVTVMDYFRRDQIDLLVATHPEADHISGLIPLVKRFPVANAIQCPVEFKTDLYRKLKKLSKQNGLAWRYVTRGDSIGGLWKYARLQALNPPNGADWQINDQSVALLLEVSDGDALPVRLLAAGDMETSAEAATLEMGDIQADLLKVAHHGSVTSSSDIFLDRVRPENAVISSGTRYLDRIYPTVKKFRKRGIVTAMTYNEGAVLFELDSENGQSIWRRVDWRKPSFWRWALGVN